ncbi:MAG TPA: glucoamylase family protein [Planctomycetota bacterium]|nr:glucoamylase family protein [Planctomycetota bacterium]
MVLLALQAFLLSQVVIAPPSGGPSTLVVEDFDHPRLHRSRLEAEWGSVNEESMRLDFSSEVRYGASGYALKVHYAARAGSPAGFWFSTAGRADDPRLSLDLGPFDELRFRTRGSADGSPGYRLRIDLVGTPAAADAAAPVASWIEEIGGGTTWDLHRIPLDLRRWVGGAKFSRVKTLRFLLATPENPAEGTFYIDGIELARKESLPFDWKSASDDDLMNYIQRNTYRFFERYADPDTGHAFDRSCYADVSSIAASGFGLAGHAIAASHGWISRAEGAERVRRLLRTLAGAGNRVSRNGVFFHFLDSATSQPKQDSEISIIDTALLISGVYVARSYFAGDREIAELADRLIRDVNWSWFYDSKRGLFYMAWSPVRRSGYEYPDPIGGGFFCGSERNPVHWGVYSDEVGLISILAAASPTHPVPITAFHSVDMTRRDYQGIQMANSYNGSLFTYLFGSCYLNTRAFGASSSDFNWYLNTSQAITANHRFALAQRLPPWAFGISACEGPDGKYHNYGAPPSTVTPDFDGTLAVYGIVGSILHRREETLKAIRELFALNLFQESGGFADAFNPLQVDPKSDLPWVNWTGFGIDQGSILLILENARTGFAWKQFESDAVIDRTLTALFPKREKR